MKKDVQSNGQLLQLVKKVAGTCQVNVKVFYVSVLTFPNCISCPLICVLLYLLYNILSYFLIPRQNLSFFSSRESVHLLNLKMKC